MANEEAISDKLTDQLQEVRELHYAAQKAVLERIIESADSYSGDAIKAMCEGAAALADSVPRIRPGSR